MLTTKITHPDGSVTIVETRSNGVTRIFVLDEFGDTKEIGSEGSGMSHQDVVKMYYTEGDSVGKTMSTPD